MRLYLSGKITGLEESDSRKNFTDAGIEFARHHQMSFYRISKSNYLHLINPFSISDKLPVKWYWIIMACDILALLTCDSILMLNNWKTSRGAKIELAIAILTGKRVFFQNEE